MINDKTLDKVKILTYTAKYDVSCSSNGSRRKNVNKGIGFAAQSGICHSYTADGRCCFIIQDNHD